MEFMGPVKRRVVEEAQGSIVAVVRRLEETGKITIARGGAGTEDELVGRERRGCAENRIIARATPAGTRRLRAVPAEPAPARRPSAGRIAAAPAARPRSPRPA